MTKLIGYARVSTKAQDTDRQIQDLLAAGSGAMTSTSTTANPEHSPNAPDSIKPFTRCIRVTPSSSLPWTDSADPPRKCSNSPKNYANAISGYGC